VTAAVGGLLAVSLAGVAVSVVGVLAARDALDRLHYLGPASIVGGGAMLLAVAVEAGASLVTARAAVVIVLVIVVGPVLAHATARAALVRGDLARIRDDDRRVDR
jgi:multicomponent Na+:H+ antiporter subunit G